MGTCSRIRHSNGFPHSSAGKESACNSGDPSLIPGSGRYPGEGIGYSVFLGFPLAQLLQWGRPGFDPWVGKIPWWRERLPTPVFWPREFHGLCSPWGHKESDMTELLSYTFIHCWWECKLTQLYSILIQVCEVLFAFGRYRNCERYRTEVAFSRSHEQEVMELKDGCPGLCLQRW